MCRRLHTFARRSATSDSRVAIAGDGKTNLLGAAPVATPGAVGNTSGKIQGSDAALLTISDTRDLLDVTVDGVGHTGIALERMTYTAAALVAEVQTKINAAFVADGKSVIVSESGGIITIRSTSSGAHSSVEVADSAGKLSLLGTAPVTKVGTGADTSGIGDLVTVAELKDINTIKTGTGSNTFYISDEWASLRHIVHLPGSGPLTLDFSRVIASPLIFRFSPANSSGQFASNAVAGLVIDANYYNFGSLPSVSAIGNAYTASGGGLSGGLTAIGALFTDEEVRLPGFWTATDDHVSRLYDSVWTKYTTSLNLTYGPGLNLIAGSLGNDTFQASLIPNASLSLMSGLIGSDTYRFGPWLNAGVILELSDIAGAAGEALFGMDTLDMSNTLNDVFIEVHPLIDSNLVTKLLTTMGVPEANIPAAFDTRDNYILVYPSVLGRKSPIPLIFTNGIENIVGGRLGATSVVFYDGATISGTISSSLGGKLELSYANYNDGRHGRSRCGV